MNTKNLRFNYHIELINDQKTWEKLLRVSENYSKYHIEPWELYTNKDFSTIEEALTFYMIWYVSDQCYDIKMWEQIYMDGKMIYEAYVEPCSTTRSEMRRVLNRDLDDRLRKYERTTENLENEIIQYKGFMGCMGKNFQELFAEYVKQEMKKKGCL